MGHINKWVCSVTKKSHKHSTPPPRRRRTDADSPTRRLAADAPTLTHRRRTDADSPPPKPKQQQQHKFIPKSRDVQNPNHNPHHHLQTLSNSLRGESGNASESTSRANETTSNQTSNFVIYLPQDDAVAAGLGPDDGGLDPVESQRVVNSLNRELSRLLRLPPKDFWREVATDGSLYEFLESFLKFRSRWYDFPHRGARGVVAGVIVGEFELCRRVFMIIQPGSWG